MFIPRALLFVAAASSIFAQEADSRAVPRPAAPAPTGGEEAFPFFARALKNDVNVRGGAGDSYSPVTRLKTGQPVRVTARTGDWYKVEVAGGLALWAAATGAGKTYIEEREPGLGIVLARDLQLRGTPDTNEPSLGELAPGDRVEIVGRRETWVNLLAPKHPGYVSVKLLRAAPDAAAAAAEFAELDVRERDARRRQSGELVKTLQRKEAEIARTKRAETALERYVTERRKPVAERDLKGAREALEAVVAEAPGEDDPHGARAKSMLDDLKTVAQLEEQLKRAKESQAEVERRAKESQLTYERDLEALRRRKEEEAAQKDGRDKKYVSLGFVRLATPVPGALESAPKYAIHRGSQREYYLVSDKYDLGDFAGKHVGVLEADAPEQRPGLTLPVLRVKKLEIIAPNP